MVIDGHVHVFPTSPVRLAFELTCYAVTWTSEACEFLDIQMQQITRLFMLIPIGRSCRLKGTQTVQSSPSQNSTNGGDADADLCTDMPIDSALTALLDDLLLLIKSGLMRTVSRS